MTQQQPEQPQSVSQKMLDDFTAELKRRKVSLRCLCGSQSFAIAGFQNIPVQQTPITNAVLTLGGPTVPCALIGCTNCGVVLNVSLVILGLYEKWKADAAVDRMLGQALGT